MKKVLVVDDNSVCLSLAKSMLSDRYSVFAVLSGDQAIKFLEKKTADLILLDINMPDMSGFETLKYLKETPAYKDIPIIFLTSDTDPETERKCFELGAYDYIIKPFQKATLRSRVGRTLDLLDLQQDLQGQLLEKAKQIARISLKSMMMIANTVDKKDPYAAHHSTNVAWFSVEIAKKLGWTGDDLYNLQNLALVHDIGNIGVSDAIIRKKGPLSPDEYEAMKKHTTLGKNILEEMTVIKKAAEIAETHHERYDGTGYPNGLKGEDIPIESRIIAVADAFDSMTSDRSYRKRLTTDQLLQEFEKGRGTQFDPQVADIAISLIKDENMIRSDAEIERDSDMVLESSKLLQKVLQEYTREVRSEAARDALTGLWNRSYASDYVNEYLTDKRHGGCFFMIDIDDFKNINDSYGHIVGDQVIRDVATELTNLVRSDDIICRIGGDEFVIFTKGNSSHSFASTKAEDIILKLNEGINIHNNGHPVSVSVGIAVAPNDGDDFVTLYTKADKALYHVKEKGKHSYHFFSDEAKPLQHSGQSTRIDLEFLHRFIREQDTAQGAFDVEYDSFKKIYRFLIRAQKRTKKPVLLLLLTLMDKEGNPPAGDIIDEALIGLKKAVTTSIRSGDVATGYSSSQYLAILVDSTPANGYLIAERIRKLFYEYTEGLEVKLNYDLDTTPFIVHTEGVASDSSDAESADSATDQSDEQHET